MMSLLFHTLSRSVIAFLPKRKCLLISWLQSVCSDFGAQKYKICHYFQCFYFYLPLNNGTGCIILVFWMLNFKSAFSLSSFTLIKRFFSSSPLSAIRVPPFAYLRLVIVLLAILIPVVIHPEYIWEHSFVLHQPPNTNTFPVYFANMTG